TARTTRCWPTPGSPPAVSSPWRGRASRARKSGSAAWGCGCCRRRNDGAAQRLPPQRSLWLPAALRLYYLHPAVAPRGGGTPPPPRPGLGVAAPRPPPEGLPLPRRELLCRSGMGFAALGLAGVLDTAGLLASPALNPLAPRRPHFPGKAR